MNYNQNVHYLINIILRKEKLTNVLNYMNHNQISNEKNIQPQKTKEKLGTNKREYFFFSIKDKNENFNKYDFLIRDKENNRKIKFIYEEEELKTHGFSTKNILYFKICDNNALFIEIKNQRSNKILLSLELNEKQILGYIKLSDIIDDSFLKEERKIIFNAKLLEIFEKDINLLRPLIDNYKPNLSKKEMIALDEFKNLFEIFMKFDKLPLLFKGCDEICDLIIDNPEDEKIGNYLLELYKFDKNKFDKLFKSIEDKISMKLCKIML